MPQRKDTVSLIRFCGVHQIELSFVERLHEFGLIEIYDADQEPCLEHDQLEILERLIRLHNELNINLEGLETVYYLSELVMELKSELRDVKDRLSVYERIVK